MNKDRPLTCYFCAKVINSESESAHLSQCGFVLEPCSNKCGSYIPRHTREKHLKICQNNINRKSWTTLKNHEAYTDFDSSAQSQITLRNKPTQSNHNLELQANVNQLSLRLSSFINKFNDYSEIQNNVIRLKTQFDKILYDLPGLVSWQNDTYYKLEELHTELRSYENLKRDNEVTVHNIQEIIKELSKLTLSFNAQQTAFANEHLQNESFQKEVFGKLNILENKLKVNIPNEEELANVNKKICEFEADNNELKQFLSETRESAKNLGLDVRTISELSTECLQKIQQQEKKILEIKNIVAQNKLDIELTEDNLENIQGLISTKPGYVIWKIDDFEKKMEMAKTKDGTYMKGPIFYSHDYGYRMRLLIYLNGLKRWRGRYLLACLQIMKGQYDDLLKWPCKLEANIVLKDCENKDNPKDYVRYITAKREYPNDEAEEPQESSTQYLFIPHDKLMKSTYIVNNSFFLEISVRNEKLIKHDNTL